MIGRIVKHAAKSGGRRAGKAAFKGSTRVAKASVRKSGSYAAKHIAGQPRKHVGKGVGYAKWSAKKGLFSLWGARPRYKRSWF